jgi:tripartite-type tricarboxylate transporter receptor subunit TctC
MLFKETPMFKKILLILLFAPMIAGAWEPIKPINVVIGYGPGTGNEITFRAIANAIAKKNPDVKFTFDYKPGADGVVALNNFLTTPADGYTILIPSQMSIYVTNDLWQADVKKFNYNSFTDIMTIGKSPLALVAKANSKTNTPEEFVKRISTTQNPVNVAVGSGAHRMAYEYIMYNTNGNKKQVQFIQFQGPAQTVLGVASDADIEFGILPSAVARPLAEAGKIKFIGLTGTRKLAQLPQVPLLKDQVPGINIYGGWSLLLPPNAPGDIVNWYQKIFSDAIRSAEYKEYSESNFVFYVEQELTPQGIKQHAEELRKTFAPVILHVSKE